MKFKTNQLLKKVRSYSFNYWPIFVLPLLWGGKLRDQIFGWADQVKIQIPKVWTDGAMKDWELPNSNPEFSAKPVSAAFYYDLPERVVYKTYPVYHPDQEPEGYWEWLHQQEAKIILDESTLVTEEDYIKAGELLFDYPIDSLGAIISLQHVRDEDFYEFSEMPLTKEGIMPFAKWIVAGKGKVYLGNLSCGMCHTKVMADGSLLKGAQGNFPGDKAFSYGLKDAPENAVKAVSGFLFSSPWVEGDPHGNLIAKKKQDILDAYAAVPTGAFGRQGTSILYPPQIPDLIGVKDRKYLDHGGLGQHRNIEDMMRYIAMNQAMDFLNFYGSFNPLGLSSEQLNNSQPIVFPGTYDRHSDRQLYALAKYVYSLQAPPNPNKPDELTEKGKIIFAEQGCVTCHTPPFFTNNKLTPVDGFEIPEEHYEKYDIFDISVGTDPGYTMKTRRGTGYYKIPSLRGLWYRGPFFHDASLANLEDVLDPKRLEESYVPTAFIGAGIKNRKVPGHEFGLELDPEDKMALIAYLKTL